MYLALERSEITLNREGDSVQGMNRTIWCKKWFDNEPLLQRGC
jgi:hypothetical protein